MMVRDDAMRLGPVDLAPVSTGGAALRAANRAARPFAPVTIGFAGGAVTIAPCAAPAEPLGCEWVEIDLAPGRLAVGLPGGTVRAVAPAGATALAPDFGAEVALDPILTALEALLGREVTLRRPAARPDLPLCRGIRFEGAVPGGDAILACDAAALPAVEAILAALPGADAPPRRLAVPMEMEIGHYDLARGRADALVPGAMIVPDQGAIRDDAATLLAGGRRAAAGRIDADGLRLIGAPKAERAEVPVDRLRLRFRVGLPDMDAAALRGLGAGAVLPLAAPPSRARIDIVAGGRCIATGALDRLGPLLTVRVTDVRDRAVGMKGSKKNAAPGISSGW